MALMTTTRKTAAMIGADFCRPPSSAMRSVPRRSQIIPTRKNMAPVVRPWLTISSTPPVTPWSLKAKNPRTMNADVDDRRVGDEPLQVLLHDATTSAP